MIKKLFVLIFIFIYSSMFANDFKKVSLQLLWKHQFEFAGYYIAKEKGFYKDLNLDVQLKEFDFDVDITNDVVSGKSTFGIGYPDIILDKANSNNIILLNAVLQSSPHVLVSLKSSGIRSIKDFKNKKIMINDNAAKTASFRSMLKSKDISLDDMIKIKHTFQIEDLIDGKVDISTCFASNELYLLDKKNIKYNVWDPKDYGYELYDDLLFTSAKKIKNNPKMVESFRRASLKGWEYAFNHIDETVDLILKKYNTQNKTKDALIYEAEKLKQLAYYKTDKFGKIDKNKIQRIYDIYNLMGLTKNLIDLDEFVYSDNSIVLTELEKQYLLNKKIINMCVDPNWMPYEQIKNGEYNGIGSDYIKLFSQKLQIPFKLIPTKSWNNSKQNAKDRVCDILPLSSSSQSRKKFMNVTKPYLKEPLVVATKLNTHFLTNFKSLKDKPIGITQGYSIVDLLKRKYPNLNIVETKSIQEGLKLVAKGELFGQVDAVSSINYHIQQEFWGELKIGGKFNESYELGMATRKDEPALHSIFNKMLDTLSEDDHRKIYNKWNMIIKTETKVDYSIVWQVVAVFSFLFIIVLFFYLRQIKLINYINKQKDEIRLNNSFLEMLFDTIPNPIFYKDKNGIYQNCNNSFSKDILGMSKEEIIGKTLHQLPNIVPKDLIDIYTQKDQELFDNPGIQNYEGNVMCSDGNLRIYQFYKATFLDESAKPLGIVGVMLDISELKKKDKLIYEHSKMAALGEMIANIAHQWRQPLTVISASSTGMKFQKEFDNLTDEQFVKNCDLINKNAQFLSKTIDDFRSYISGDLKVIEFSLKDKIENFIKLVDPTIKNNHIKVIFDSQEDIKIKSYPNYLIQCFINIFNNAKDALVENNSEDDRYIFIDQKITDDKVVITIKDNAGGILEDILPKVFEPYFTTKHQSQGTGLGLHMTYNLVVNSMKGTITVNNTTYEYNGKRYKGARFEIVLQPNHQS